MQARLSFITLGVADIDKAKRFYNHVLGWSPFQDNGGIVMYRLNGLVLSLFPQHELMAHQVRLRRRLTQRLHHQLPHPH